MTMQSFKKLKFKKLKFHTPTFRAGLGLGLAAAGLLLLAGVSHAQAPSGMRLVWER